jgi:hypothetical protein
MVLGAGASVHCEYPLGLKLISQLSKLKFTWHQNEIPDKWSFNDVTIFLTRLSRSGHYSIDAFLETNIVDADLGKFLIAYELKKHEIIDNLFPPSDSGWYQYLFNRLLPEKGSTNFANNRLSIITFNYDRSLETYLHVALQARFNMNENEATSILKQIPIFHVHGILGDYPKIPYDKTTDIKTLEVISRQIQIIHELTDQKNGFCNSMFEQSHEVLMNAERIYFLGFGFHPDNISRLRFFTPKNTVNKSILGTLMGMGPIEMKNIYRRLTPLGITTNCFPNPGLECNNFFSYIGPLD